jgi:metal-responsive CopG/Arc/MetJ family transcriptional regulator
MGKVTYTLDDETVDRVRKLAQRARKPQSQIVREAVAHYAQREDKLSDDERARLLGVLEELMARAPKPGDRTAADVDRELRDIRRARRSGGRLHPVE